MFCKKKDKIKKHSEKAFKLFRNIIKTFFGYEIKSIDDLTPSYYTKNEICFSIENITSKLRSNNSIQFIEFFQKNKNKLMRYGITLIELPGPIITDMMPNIGEQENLLLKITSSLYNRSSQNLEQSAQRSLNENIEEKIEKKIIERKNSYIIRQGVSIDLENKKHLDRAENNIRFYQLRYIIPKIDITNKIFEN